MTDANPEDLHYIVKWHNTAHMTGYPLYEVYPHPIVREPDRDVVVQGLSFPEANRRKKELEAKDEKETTKA